jgi:aldehyde:ferredoxin oxidoreductase
MVPSVLNYQNVWADCPRNYTSGTFKDAERISGEAMADTILKGNDTCYACVVRCKRVVEADYGSQKVDRLYGGPEYETLSTFGAYCGVNDLNAIALANQTCQHGVNTISCGATMRLRWDALKRILTTTETGGIDLRFGNAEAMLALLDKIVHREGIGDLLANGSARAAQEIANGAEDLVVAVKNQELPAHMPQVKRSLALIYAVNPFGADHQSSEHDPGYSSEATKTSLERMARLGLNAPQPDRVLNHEKVKFTLRTQWNYSFMDSADLCQFVFGPSWQLFGPDEMVELMRAVTGWEITIDEVQRIGERRLNLLRLFNAREGAGRDHDSLPKRLFDEPLKGGASDGVSITRGELNAALDDYYAMAGWDMHTGIPTNNKLQELGLSEFI